MIAIDDDCSFDDDLHEYRNGAGLIRPSATETLKYGGLFDYSRVDPRKLEAKRIIGKNGHAWTARYDLAVKLGGELPSFDELTEEEEAYCRAWPKFRKELPFEVIDIEKAMVRPIAGLEVGGTPDRKIRIGHRLVMLEIKFVAAFHAGWKLQLADYVMQESGRHDCSAYGRAVVRLTKDGRFHYNPIDPKWDAADSAAATAFVQTFAWKKNHKII